MKQFISKINKYLIEHHPTLWNTKVVWMLGASIIIHILFFLFGLITLTNPESLQDRGAENIFFENGTIFFSMMISVVMLVLWLVFMFKNNAFKNYYPTSAFKLFKQFVLYFIILFFSTTFYFSYNFGLKTYIVNKYPDSITKNEILTANKASVFLSHSLESYTVDRLVYPKPFDSLHCVTEYVKINLDKPHLDFLGEKYQFYNLKYVTYPDGDKLNNYNIKGYVYYKHNEDSTTTYAFKDSVVDVSAYLKSAKPSYYNYSKIFYSYGKDNVDYLYSSYDYDPSSNRYGNISKKQLIQKGNFDLLNRNNPDEIKQLLNDFLQLAKKYKIKTNLDTNSWFKMVYNPTNFEVKHLILDREPYYDESYISTSERSDFEIYQDKIMTKKFIDSQELEIVFENLDDIKNKTIIDASIHAFIWIAFAIALLIFCFRVTSLRSVLFTLVGGILLTIFVSLVAAAVGFTSRSGGIDFEYFMMYFILFISTIILVIGLFGVTKLKKLVGSIFINLTLSGFVAYVLLIMAIITSHQSDTCRLKYPDYLERKEHCFVLLRDLGLWSSLILFVAGIIFTYLYCNIILKWRATPEH